MAKVMTSSCHLGWELWWGRVSRRFEELLKLSLMVSELTFRICWAHRYWKSKIDCLRFVMCLHPVPVFQGFFFCCSHWQYLWSKQGRQYVPLSSLYYLDVNGWAWVCRFSKLVMVLLLGIGYLRFKLKKSCEVERNAEMNKMSWSSIVSISVNRGSCTAKLLHILRSVLKSPKG